MGHKHTVSSPRKPNLGSHAKFNTMMQFPVGHPRLHQQPPVPLSSVLHTPPQARRHSLAHLFPFSVVTLAERLRSVPPTAWQSSPEKEKTPPLRMRGRHCCDGDLLFSSAGALVVHGILQRPSSLFTGLNGEHLPSDTLEKCFSLHTRLCC